MRRAIKLDESLVTTHKQGSRRGWKKIDQFEHELTQTRVLLYMSTNTADRTIFDCNIDGHELRSEISLGDLKKKVQKFLEEYAGIDWQHVIEIKVDESTNLRHYYRDGDHSAQVSVQVKEMMVTTKPVNQDYLVAQRRDNDEFHTPEQYLKDAKKWGWRIKDQGKFEPPMVTDKKRGYDAGITIYLPYSQGTWAAIMELLKQIEQIRERLAEFMSQDDIVERLESVGVPLLTAPKDQEGETT